jgi:glycosyltransferase involved in cell wall biosynthesis
MTIRALYVLDTVNRGGIETQALDAVRVARGLDLAITVVTTGGQLLNEFQSATDDVVVLKRRMPVDPTYAIQLRKAIDEHAPQIVQGHQAVDALHLAIATRGHREIKRVITVEGFIPDTKNRLALRLLLPRMDAVVFPSQALRQWVRERDGIDSSSNGVVIANGADPERLKRSKTDVRFELGVADDDIVIGMVANFYPDPRKDQFTLIKALPAIFSRFPNAHCLIVGGVDGGAEEKLAACKRACVEANIADRVHFLGSRNDVPAILSSLDLFVFSSLHEGGAPPIAIIEAMFAKVPVAASDIPPHVEYARNALRTTVLFKTGDAQDLAEKVIALLSDPRESQAITDRAYEYAMANLTATARIRRLKDLYERLLAA